MNIRRLLTFLFTALFISLITINCKSDAKKDNESESDADTNQQAGMNMQMPNTQQPVGEITDAEIEQFISLFLEIRELEQQLQFQAVQIIQNSPLSMEKYREIASAQQNPNSAGQSNFSEENMTAYNEISEEIQGLQMKAQQQSQGVIEKSDMSPNRYRQIGQASQTDTTLQRRLQEEFKTKQPAPQQPAQPGGMPQQMPPQQ